MSTEPKQEDSRLQVTQRGYVAPIERKTLFGKRYIDVYDLQHEEAIDDLIGLLQWIGRGETVEIRIASKSYEH